MLFNFELGNQVYAKARVKPTTKANLWLGADVMLEYPLDEAIQLLVRFQTYSKLSSAQAKVSIYSTQGHPAIQLLLSNMFAALMRCA